VRSEDWQIVHGNLMTILMIFFLAMFSFFYVHQGSEYEKIVAGIQADFGGKIDKTLIKKAAYREKERAVAQELEEYKGMEGLKKFTKIQTDREKIKIIFPDPVIFSLGSADLKPDTIWMLGEIAVRLRLLPKNKIVIEGHTDNIPIKSGGRYSSNWELSLARSLSIVHYLTEFEGIAPERFVPAGYGEYRPLYPNDTPEHRALNRRVEIVILAGKE